MGSRLQSCALLAIATVISQFSLRGPAQDVGQHQEVGIVYYLDGESLKPLEKEIVAQGGRSRYVAKVNGEHATIRLHVDQQHLFRVCGVDPSRFRLYRFKVEKNARTVTIAKNNMWVGGSKVVLMDSEIPVSIQSLESGCFTLTPKSTLVTGEYNFSPLESLDAFTFGVGEIEKPK